MKIFSIRDSKAKAFLQPFFSPNIATALRAVASAVNEEGHQFNRYSVDYDLYEIGSFDDSNGKLGALSAPQHVANLDDIHETPDAAFAAAALGPELMKVGNEG